MSLVKAFSLTDQHVEMIKRLKQALGIPTYSEAVRFAIELAYSIVSKGNAANLVNRGRVELKVQAPITINIVKAESKAEAKIDVKVRKLAVEVRRFLLHVMNPPRNLVPPPPWLREEAEKLYSKLATALEA